MVPSLTPNQYVELVLTVQQVPRQFGTRVREVGTRQFTVARPECAGEPVPVDTQRVELNMAWRGVTWVLYCPVTGVTPERVYLAFPPAEGVERVQRRRDLRVVFRTPVNYEVVGEHDSGPTGQGLLHDLSGGGCLLVLDEELAVGTLIRVHVGVGGPTALEVVGKVVRSAAVTPKDGTWLFGLEFVKIPERDRERIIKFVFAKHLDEVRRLR